MTSLSLYKYALYLPAKMSRNTFDRNLKSIVQDSIFIYVGEFKNLEFTVLFRVRNVYGNDFCEAAAEERR
jgi:hypothetical protein